MRKTAIILLVVVLGVFIWSMWPENTQPEDALHGVSIAMGQESFARQYALGLLYEESGLWTAALERYETAAMAEQPEIRTAAETAIQRTLVKQGDWRRQWRAQWRNTAVWLGQVVGLATAVILVLGSVRLALRHRAPQPGYSLRPVQDFTKEKLGQGVHARLYLRLQEAREAQQEAQSLLRAQNLAAGFFPALTPWQELPEAVGQALAVLDKVSVAGVNVQLRPLAQVSLTFLQQKEYTVSGQLHQEGKRLHLRAEIRRSPAGTIVASWDIYGDPERPPAEQLGPMIDAWAYRMLRWSEEKGTGVTSWRSLAAYMRGMILWRQYLEDGRYAPDLLRKAADQFRRAWEADPLFPQARFALGAIYNTQGHYAEAEQVFRELLDETDAEETALPLRYNLAVSLYHQVSKGKWARDSATEQLQIIRETLAERTDDQSRLLLSLADSSQALIVGLKIGAREKKKKGSYPGGDEAEAHRLVEAARTTAGQIENEDARRTALAAADHAAGFVWLQLGQKEKARPLLQQAIQRRPSYVVPYVNLAETYEKGAPEAVVWLRRAVTIQPGFAFGWFRLGQAYDRQAEGDPSRTDMARAAYEKAAGFADAQERLGTIAFKAGDYEGAMAHYQAGIRLNRRKEYIWRNMAWRTLEATERGLIERDDGRLQEALSWAARAVMLAEGQPQEWRAYDTRGWAWLLLGDLDKARDDFENALNLLKKGGKSAAQVWYHMALLYKQKNKPQEALGELGKASQAKDKKWAEKIARLQEELEAECST